MLGAEKAELHAVTQHIPTVLLPCNKDPRILLTLVAG